MNINNYGFIITRHVNSENTNKYWNRCVRCIRKFYPLKKIVVIDDNSKPDFVKAEFEYRNIEFIQSEFPGRGELLPYYYFYKRRFFNNAVIIHDSVFFHKRVDFDKIRCRALPLWHFNKDSENVDNTIRLVGVLKNNYEINKQLIDNELKVLGLNERVSWFGCFGGQSYINYEFLSRMQAKYSLFNLLDVVKCRSDRCCLERILGIIFFGNQRNLYKTKSLLGNIHTYSVWGYTFDEYCNFLNNKKYSPLPLVKVWTGR
jgi:hypothetical protein